MSRRTRSRSGPPETGLIVLAVLAAAALLAYLIGPKLLERRGTAPRAPSSVRESSDRLRAALGDPADPAAATRVLHRAIENAVRDAGLAPESLRERVGARDGAAEWELAAPDGFSLLRLNLAVTRSVERAGGAVLDGYAEPGSGVWVVVGTESKALHRVLLRTSLDEEMMTVLKPKRIALVVEDTGDDLRSSLDAFLELGIPVTLAVRPGSAASRSAAERARAAGADVLLHLPMEPKGYPRIDPGPDAILVDLKDGEIRKRIARHLESLPPVDGVSSHMGSLATQDRRVMSVVLEELKRRRLFFLDSHTTKATVAPEEARRIGVPCLVNRVYLDNEEGDDSWVGERLDEAAAAAANGAVIATAHAHPRTAVAVQRALPRLRKQGLEFVTVSALLAEREGAIP